MSPLRALAPDQRAVLELLLRQGRTYEELSEMLGLPEAGVRDRAQAALAALAPERVAPVGEDGAVADWILGQQDDEEAERTAESVARMPAWHAWASEITDRLSEVEGAEIPELPEPEAEPARPAATRQNAAGKRPRPVRDGTAGAAGAQKARARADAPAAKARPKSEPAKARPRPVRERAAASASAPAAEPAGATSGGGGLPLRSSRLGGALVIGALVLIVGVFLAWFLTRDDDGGTKSASATPTATATATPRVVNEVTLKGVGNKAQGLMRVFQREQDGKLVFALAADNVPKNKAQEVYAVWFTKKGGQPRNLGFAQTQVGDNHVFTTGGPQQGQETDFAKWLADYDKVIVARASADAASSKRPGQVVLQGTLPGGQS